jgi:DNA-directed RNA polymerase specialized sigma24 family protein
MQNDDRLKAAAPIASEKLHRDGKLAAERLVGGTDQLTASELMNELQASGGTNSKVLSELMVRHEQIVFNTIHRANVRLHDIDKVASRVWRTVWRISMKPRDQKGAWDPTRARHTKDPFVPLVKRIANSKAMDYHRKRKSQRKRWDAFEQSVRLYGAAWREQAECRQSGSRGAAAEKAEVAGLTRRAVAAARGSLGEIIGSLPEKERVVLELHGQGLKNCEIAPIVGCGNAEVSRRLKRARQGVIAKAMQAAR